jgi:hypothetical protein
MLYVFLFTLLAIVWYLDRSKERFDEWVNKKFSLPKRLRFIDNKNLKEEMSVGTLNKEIRDLRSILMALCTGLAVLISVALVLEVFFDFPRLDILEFFKSVARVH